MVILILSTFYSGGGAEIQAISELRYINNYTQDIAYMITFDPKFRTGESREYNHINLWGKYTINQRRLFDTVFNNKLYKLLAKEINKVKPNLVHMHNVSFSYKTICKAVKNFKVVETIHDYSLVCSKGSYILPDGNVCKECNWENCMKNCFNTDIKSRIKAWYRNYYVEPSKKNIRLNTVNYIIAPSKKLTDVLNCFGYGAVCVNNSIDTSEFTGFKKLLPDIHKIKKIVYLGSIRKGKGILKLLEVYHSNEYETIELHLVGKIDKSENETEVKKMIEKSSVIYDGYMKHEQLIDFLNDVFAIIIPSYWMENYPNVALEGALAECVVSGSDRGGMPEMIVDKKLIFDIVSPESVKSVLKYIDEMSFEKYMTICSLQKEKFAINNTQKIYYSRLMQLVKKQRNSGAN